MGKRSRQPKSYQVRLRTLFLAVGLIAIGLAVWSAYVRPYRVQANVADRIKAIGGSLESRGGPTWLQKILGADDVQDVTLVNLADADPSPDLLSAVRQLPHLEVLIVGGDNITAETFPQLPESESLQAAIFDSTYLSLEQLDEFRAARPGVYVGRSDRRNAIELNLRVDHFGPNVVTEQFGNPSTELQNRIDPHYGLPTSFDPPCGYFNEITFVQKSALPKPSEESLRILPKFMRLKELGLFSWSGESAATMAPEDLQHMIDRLQPALNRITSYRTDGLDDGGLKIIAAIPQLEALSIYGLVTDTDLDRLAEIHPGVKSLDLSFTHVDDPAIWPSFPLEHLAVSCTNIDDTDVAAIAAKYPRLKTLDLEETWVTDAGVAALAPLKELVGLQLDLTRATDTSLETLQRLPNLEQLSIGLYAYGRYSSDWDQFFDDESGEYEFGPDLYKVSPDRKTEIRSRLARGEFRLSPNYSELRTAVVINPLESLNLDAVPMMQHIKIVRATGTYLDDAGLRELVRAFPNMRALDASRTWIADDAMDELANLEHLQSLDVSETRVTTEGLTRLGESPKLEEIRLSDGLGGECVQALLAFPNLKALEFELSQRGPYDRFTREDIGQFRQLAKAMFQRRVTNGRNVSILLIDHDDTDADDLFLTIMSGCWLTPGAYAEVYGEPYLPTPE